MTASADAKQDDELSINEGRDIAYQRKEWVAQRIAWLVMLALVVAALIGLLGAPGLVASDRKSAADGSVEIEYDRIGRYHAPTELIVEVAPEFIDEGEVRLWFSTAYADALSIESFVPEPESAEARPDGVVYSFRVGDASGPLRIVIHYEHDSYWRASGELGLVNGEAIEMSQIVMP